MDIARSCDAGPLHDFRNEDIFTGERFDLAAVEQPVEARPVPIEISVPYRYIRCRERDRFCGRAALP
jgi:hypothetical protein